MKFFASLKKYALWTSPYNALIWVLKPLMIMMTATQNVAC